MKAIKKITKGALIAGFLLSNFSYADEQGPIEITTQEEQNANQLQLPERVEVKSKDLQIFSAIWQRIAQKMDVQYDADEYPEITRLNNKVNKLKKRCADQDIIVLADKEAEKLILAWEDVELLLLSAPRSDMPTKEGKRTIPSLSTYDLLKARRFMARVKECLHDVKLYRFGCTGSISTQINTVINTLGNCTTNKAEFLDCSYSDVTSLVNDINALCPIVTLLRTILAELRGVGPGPAFCS